MYYPYLRGKQFELIALRELLELGLLDSHVIPVIEPVKASSTLQSTLIQFQRKNHFIAVIQNPRVAPYLPFNNEVVTELKQDATFIPATFIDQINDLEALQQYVNPEKMVVIPKEARFELPEDDAAWDQALKLITVDNTRMIRRAKGHVIELDDSFTKEDRNSDYAGKDDQFFSDNHLYFHEDGFSGFSDYSVIGSEYTDKGFAPMAVAIHIVYFDPNDNLRIKHFVSDTNFDNTDPAGKFSEALEKLVSWHRGVDFDHQKNDSHALSVFDEMHDQKQYSGLGVVKKLSIQHHLEIMGRYLDQRCRV
ncbi:sce7725 family protein [Schleiferilactobacillus harbinensis]|uniref:sce7725 family protein n=1 Tax=Schleiferilactobacillus harbinensis TaxID=304207 RepID=UPI00116AA599|nr:sce7725 family protein [Schleiferilactobacillus harbinensis]GEK07237.1 hypothetical protein LHA01_24760 [Schleiferilactobacillus harbinensis]